MQLGSLDVDAELRPHWEPSFGCPYRYFHNLPPGASWWDLPEADPAKASQTFVVQTDTPPMPPDVLAARELLAAGACTAYAIDLWGGSVCLIGVAPQPTSACSCSCFIRPMASAMGVLSGCRGVLGRWNHLPAGAQAAQQRQAW